MTRATVPAHPMQPLAAWPLAERQRIVGVFTDIDDTLTTAQAITPDALQALADLRAAGLVVVPITGRPAGWCAPHAQGDAAQRLPRWPVDALVAENGGVAFVPRTLPGDAAPSSASAAYQPAALDEPLTQVYYAPEAERAAAAPRLRQAAERVLREVPGAALSPDAALRETDIAIDYNDRILLAPDQVRQVLAILHDEGLQATVSSIHINGWVGRHDKLQAARWMVRLLCGRNLDDELERWVYVGDSTNDQAMFAHFRHSVGVANILRFADQLAHWPRYLAPSERGAGFAEVAQALLAARAA